MRSRSESSSERLLRYSYGPGALHVAQVRPQSSWLRKTYAKGILNPLFSSDFAHVRAENPIFSKTCRRCMA